jgi:hypothetical protein
MGPSRWSVLSFVGVLIVGCTMAIQPANGSPAHSVRPLALATQPVLSPQSGNAPRMVTTTSAIQQSAGYVVLMQSPTSVQGTFVLPSFYCTDTQNLEILISIGGATNVALGYLDVECYGAGQTPTLTGAACAGLYGTACGTPIQASTGDHISIWASLTTAGATATLRDLTKGLASSKSGKGGTPSVAEFDSLTGSISIPTFTTLTFSGAEVNGTPLSSWAPTPSDMTEAGATEVHTGALSNTGMSFSTTYVASEPCLNNIPTRPGNPAPQPGQGFDGLYRLGNSGAWAAPTSGPPPTVSPGPFAALGGVYADILNCSPFVANGSTVSAWVMLEQFGQNGQDYIQIGWEKHAGKRPQIFVELRDTTDKIEDPQHPFESCDDRSTWHELWCLTSPLPAASPGTFTNYIIEYVNGTFQLYIEQLSQTFAQRQLVAEVSSAEFTPNLAYIMGETHSTHDQMPGTAAYPEVVENAKVYNSKDTNNGWESFYGQVNYGGNSVPQSFTTKSWGANNWYGCACGSLPTLAVGASPPKTGQMFTIWDAGS